LSLPRAPCAECSALGKGALCREPNFTECGTQQSLLCRVPDKRHSAKNTTLGKAYDSGSVGNSIITRPNIAILDEDVAAGTYNF
jgi:hypothetical protein